MDIVPVTTSFTPTSCTGEKVINLEESWQEYRAGNSRCRWNVHNAYINRSPCHL